MSVGVEDGPYRLRGASDVAWPSQGYGQRTGFGRRIAEFIRAVMRMVLPVLGLSAAISAMYLYMDSPLPYLADESGKWLTVSHLILPAVFLTVHLTNRRYGPAYAFAQIVISFAVLAAATIFAGDIIQRMLPQEIIPSVRVVASFGIAFFVAGFFSVVAFDGMRGPRWWTAPLIGSLVASLIYAPIFYMTAYLGTMTPWFNHMAIHAGLLVGGAILALIPYWLLRSIIQPLPGYGGY